MSRSARVSAQKLPTPPENISSERQKWWQRSRVLLPAVAFVALILGIGIGGTGVDPAELDAAHASAAEVEDRLAEESARADEAEALAAALDEQLTDLEAVLIDAKDDISDLEQQVEEALDTARAEVDDEREAAMAEINEEREAMTAELEQRAAELDEHKVALDERAAELDDAEVRQAMSTFGNGVHVVGEDILPGVYRTQGGSNCYWARLSGLGGGLGDIIANGLPQGPASVEIRASDAAFESSGCGEWTLN